MILQRSALIFLLWIVSFFAAMRALAQPVLPAIAGTAEKGAVLLSWVCQYDGVKAIEVKHSADSLYNYKTIGYVSKTVKGLQAFADGSALPGKNFYKLNIIFNSGLNWNSNYCRVLVDSVQVAARGGALPANDSLQQYIVAENIAGADTAAQSKKISLQLVGHGSYDGSLFTTAYVHVNKVSGHVEVSLPADSSPYHYAIKFYNSTGHIVVDVPSLSAHVIIIDKRNFQRRGQYRFVLSKDDEKVESGFILLSM